MRIKAVYMSNANNKKIIVGNNVFVNGNPIVVDVDEDEAAEIRKVAKQDWFNILEEYDEKLVKSPIVEEIAEAVNEAAEEDVVNEAAEEDVVNEAAEEDVVNEAAEEDVVNEAAEEDVVNEETVEEAVANEEAVEAVVEKEAKPETKKRTRRASAKKEEE